MRSAAALFAVVLLQGCSRTGEDRDAILLAGLEELGRAYKDPRMPLCASLSERRPLAKRSWAFVQGVPPAGFEDLADSAPLQVPLSLEPLRRKLPKRWYIGEQADALCFQFTRPVIRDSRAVVTGSFGDAGEALSGTWNFWLRRQDDRWRVVATTKGHHDI